ncbi:hypothetical protein C7446_1167 [Kushneria sinocarnis]|uniref:Uncharacterized protein n=1 Tax=Kushneria sinocarnis TaxID=595502 RepID=A0A420WYC8_9GAMM|nr:hypothetical protein C7446_1167 [Kushneria sinocarnis]
MMYLAGYLLTVSFMGVFVLGALKVRSGSGHYMEE